VGAGLETLCLFFQRPYPRTGRRIKGANGDLPANGQTFGKVDLPLAEKPGIEGDAKLSGATPISDFVEPVRWVIPTVLKLNRHDYYQTADKAGSVQDSVRVYDITATIGADGKARIDSKLVEKESY